MMSEGQENNELNSGKADAFGERMVTVLNDGMLCLMASIGRRLGLFDAMRDAPPLTTHEIAARSGLNERYVREWIGAMVASRVVEVVKPDLYWLPPEHAAVLTRPAAANNLALYMQYVAVAAGVEDLIVECFEKGGGIPYEKYPRFHEVQAEDSGTVIIPSLENHVLPLIPGLVGRLRSGIRVHDAGCGRGRTLNRMATLFPESRFSGLDLSEDAIEFARREASARGLRNVEFVEADLTDFDAKAPAGAFDLITTFDAVHDQAQPLRLLTGICRALKEDGVYLM